jgi:hypothetical protein
MEENNENNDNNEQEADSSQSVDTPPDTQSDLKESSSKSSEVALDPRLYTDDGKFNADGAKEYLAEIQAEKQKYEERLLGLRKVVSRNGDVVKEPTEYFQDFAPPERFNKFFNEETPEETKEYLGGMINKLSSKYLDMGLNKQQALEMSNTILEVMEEVGVLDTRTEEQKYIDKQKLIAEQMGSLGANAEMLVREAEVFILNTPSFNATQKNRMLDMIKQGDVGLVDVIHSIKDSFGSKTGGVPSNITALGGLKSDAELRDEYSKASPERREEIIRQRHKAGRAGKLFD